MWCARAGGQLYRCPDTKRASRDVCWYVRAGHSARRLLGYFLKQRHISVDQEHVYIERERSGDCVSLL